MKQNLKYLLFYAILIFIFFADGILADKLIAVGDGIVYNYPLHAYYAKYIKHFSIPLWLPYEYSGIPFLAVGTAGPLYPVNMILHFLFSDSIAYNLNLLLHYLIACFFTFLYARLIGCKELPSFIAGAVFGLSGFMIAHHGNLQMQNAAALIPVIFYLFEKTKLLLTPKYALGAGIIIAFQILSGHVQIAVYTLCFLALYIIFNFFHVEHTKRPRFVILCLLSFFIGIILALPQLLSTKEMASYSWRIGADYKFFTEYSLSPLHLITYFFPYFLGGGAGIYVWGPWIFADFMAYAGILPLLIGLIAFLKEWRTNPHVRFWGLISMLAIFLSLGRNNPFYRIMFYVPVYNLFRIPTRNLVFLDFALAVLCAFGLSILFSEDSKSKAYAKLLLKLTVIVLIVSLVLVTGILMTMKFFGSVIDKLLVAKYSLTGSYTISKPALYLPVIILALSLIIMYFYHKSGKRAILYLLPVVLLLDLYSFNYLLLARKAWISRYKIENICQTPLYTYFQDKSDARAAMIDQSGIINHIQCKISTIHGYEPLVFNKFKILMNLRYNYGLIWDWDELLKNNIILSLLNVKYIATTQPEKLSGNPSYQKITQLGKESIFLNKNYVPRISSVTLLRSARDIYEIKELLMKKEIDPQREAILYSSDFAELRNHQFVKGSATILRYEPEEIAINITTQGPSFFILADMFYPHWKAYLDNKEIKIYEVDGLLRGVLVPQGSHSLIFRYKY